MATTPTPRLRARGLTVGHGSTPIVRGVDLGLDAATVTGVLGCNGSGKSTLLRTLAGLQAPLAGEVLVNGTPLGDLGPKAAARQISFLPQSPLVPPGLTVRELVGHGRHPYRRLLGGMSPADVAAVDEALRLAGIDDLADRPVELLSGGERQRSWFAVALAQQTDIVLLDEPTTYLDIRHQLEVLTSLRRLVEDRALTVVCVLHDINQAAEFCDRLVLVADGAVLADGDPHEVVDPEHLRVAYGVEATITTDTDTARPVGRFHLPVLTEVP